MMSTRLMRRPSAQGPRNAAALYGSVRQVSAPVAQAAGALSATATRSARRSEPAAGAPPGPG
jgi:hypothetical protein